MTMKRWPRSWPRSSISSKRSIIGSGFTRPSAICHRSNLKLRFRHHYFLNFLCHFRGALHVDAPKLVLKSVLTFGETTDEGKIVQAVTLPWFEILELLKNDPNAAFQIPADKWEEII